MIILCFLFSNLLLCLYKYFSSLAYNIVYNKINTTQYLTPILILLYYFPIETFFKIIKNNA